jgi:hypothetical protein
VTGERPARGHLGNKTIPAEKGRDCVSRPPKRNARKQQVQRCNCAWGLSGMHGAGSVEVGPEREKKKKRANINQCRFTYLALDGRW